MVMVMMILVTMMLVRICMRPMCVSPPSARCVSACTPSRLQFAFATLSGVSACARIHICTRGQLWLSTTRARTPRPCGSNKNEDEDPRLSDSANVAACVTIDGLLEGRHPELFKPSTGRGRPRLICEVLSAETDRALGSSSAKDSALTRLDVFQTSALEAALFTIASIQAPVFNCFVQLLRRSNDFGEFLSVSAQAYLKDRSDTGMVGIEVLRELVRQAGDVFLGYFPEHSIAPTVLPVKRPELTVSADVRLLVITKRAEDLEL